jgi:hypothetical protein
MKQPISIISLTASNTTRTAKKTSEMAQDFHQSNTKKNQETNQ